MCGVRFVSANIRTILHIVQLGPAFSAPLLVHFSVACGTVSRAKRKPPPVVGQRLYYKESDSAACG